MKEREYIHVVDLPRKIPFYDTNLKQSFRNAIDFLLILILFFSSLINDVINGSTNCHWGNFQEINTAWHLFRNAGEFWTGHR